MLAVAKSCLVCRTPLTALEARTSAVCARLACRWAHRTLPVHEACRVCGRPLAPPDRAARTCQGACRTTLHGAEAREQERRREALRIAEAHALRDGAAATAGVAEPDAFPVTLVPLCTAPPTRLPRRRRRALRAHVARLVAEARSAAATEEGGADAVALPTAAASDLAPDPDTAADATLGALLGGACAQCRGSCCQTGGDHAWLTAATMRRYLADHSDASTAAVVDAYAAHLSPETPRRSCVYHGAAGCTLPRTMRSDTCNGFLCGPLKSFRERVRAGDAARAFFAATADGPPRTGAFVDARDVRVVRRGGTAAGGGAP